MVDTKSAPRQSLLLQPLAEQLVQTHDLSRLFDALNQRQQVSLDGVWGSVRALLVAAISSHRETIESAHQHSGPLVIILPHSNEIDLLCDDLELFTDLPVGRFPAWESDPGEQVYYDEIYGDRLRILKQLTSNNEHRPPLIVTSIQSLQQPVPAESSLFSHSQTLKIDSTLDQNSFVRWLVEKGFHQTSAVELPGEFTARGGIVDVFTPDCEQPVRIEFFDDQIETIRFFDVASQRSLAKIDAIDITLLEFNNSDSEHLSAYLPQESWVLLFEPTEINRQGKLYLERLDDHQSFHSCHDVLKSLSNLGTASVEEISSGQLEVHLSINSQSVEQFSGDLQKVSTELATISHGEKVFIVCHNEAEISRLREIFSTDKSQVNLEQLFFITGYLHKGFHLPDQQVIVISADELFHRSEINRSQRRRLGKAIDSFLDLQEGDLVVHLTHGIGRYRGLEMLEKDNHTEEHLNLEFSGGTRIYVPCSKINLVQKYVGGTKKRPTLAKIGGKAWVRQKEAAQQAVTDMAADMIDLQAARNSHQGIVFPQDSEWQREFDGAFAYHETPDQLTAIAEIKNDMQQPRAMDRLLCGDVGFGKTEVAIRATFKAVDAGYQVGLLAPTTILVEQHFRTFTERMAEFPFKIAKLSRFCTKKQQRETVAGLKAGTIDIVVGTHRLAQKDIAFQNLGLVIIDEEQRFGVDVKDRLKHYRNTVDVLTMTATPIPRTLHMSLLGLRSISNLETAPEERIAVETRVTRFSEETIRHAVLRELNRDGQIFFVHNRVGDIELIAQRLRAIVPEASIEIGHGQMPEGQLERVMFDFVNHRFDLLLATTIVESGLDIPNANTIFIDEADRYGLAEMHQLRGRVGRYKHRAYCYLLIDPKKSLSPVAARRLRAIEEFSKLGAGFAIAMRDLEIRGAGNILGSQQSGHIATVGYELYCQMLEATVRRMKKMPLMVLPEVNIELPVKAYLPRHYVTDMRLKIDLYRRLARVSSDEDIAGISAELIDRFGKQPPEAKRLLLLASLRLAAGRWLIESIHIEDCYLVFRYQSRPQIERLSKNHGNCLRIADSQSAYLPMAKRVNTAEEFLEAAKSLLL